jgi:hypothetical protein
VLRYLSLFAVVATLLVARVAFSAGVPSSDRAEVPSGGDDGTDAGDGSDVVLPCRLALTAVLSSTRCATVEAERVPATSEFSAPIFRPPISALA